MRNTKGLKEALKHSHSINSNNGETFNLKGTKSPVGYGGSSREELLNRIEILEYDVTVLNDTISANQRNYENISRLLKIEKEKNGNLAAIVNNGAEEKKNGLETELRVAQERIKVLFFYFI